MVYQLQEVLQPHALFINKFFRMRASSMNYTFLIVYDNYRPPLSQFVKLKVQ